jgi:clan AA aspartic protease
MINGKVTATLEATIEIEVSGPNPAPQQTETVAQAVIDTGFNGYLTLPSQLVSLLNLPLAGSRYATLGDGSVVSLDAYYATVSWHGQNRKVLVLQGDGDALVGMSLLHGSRFSMNVVADGDVVIEELPLAMRP